VTIDIIAGGGGQEDHGSGQIAGLAPTLRGDAIEDLLAALGIGADWCGVIGDHVAGRDCVDVKAMRSPLVGKRFGEPRDGVF
jgi:hypothetical protein